MEECNEAVAWRQGICKFGQWQMLALILDQANKWNLKYDLNYIWDHFFISLICVIKKKFICVCLSHCEEGWELKNWCFSTVVLEKTLESPLDCKEIQPVHSKGDQPWDIFGRNDAKAERPVLWPPHAKSGLIGKDSDAGRDWGQEEKGMTDDEMAGWHHWLDGRESGLTPGVGNGQGGLVCCDSWGRRVGHDWATELNWTELIPLYCDHQETRNYKPIWPVSLIASANFL